MLPHDQRPFHACFPMTGNRAVEDVLSWLAHFHVHNASTSLGEDLPPENESSANVSV